MESNCSCVQSNHCLYVYSIGMRGRLFYLNCMCYDNCSGIVVCKASKWKKNLLLQEQLAFDYDWIRRDERYKQQHGD